MKLLEASKGSPAHQQESFKMYHNNMSGAQCGSNDHNGCSSMNECITPNNLTLSKDIFAENETTIDFSIDLNTNAGEFLEYTEEGHPSFVLTGINTLRKQGLFCDVMLVVEDREFHVHRAILAACSPYLFDFLSCMEETAESQPTYKLKDVAYIGFHFLVDYMYTGRLHVPLDSVPGVYATAIVLKMESAVRACANFLSTNLTPANCLGIITTHIPPF